MKFDQRGDVAQDCNSALLNAIQEKKTSFQTSDGTYLYLI